MGGVPGHARDAIALASTAGCQALDLLRPAARTTTHGARGARADRAPRTRERHLGLRAHYRRAAQARNRGVAEPRPERAHSRGRPTGAAAWPAGLALVLAPARSKRDGLRFFTVDTVFLRRLYVLVFIRIGTRRIEYIAATSHPDGPWVTQQARNLLMDLEDRSQPARFIIHDRDTKFSRAFDAVFEGAGMNVIRTPIQAPNANAYVERWVGTARRECLDRLLIFSRRQLEHVLAVFVRHYNAQRPHRALALRAPDTSAAPSARGDPARRSLP